MDVENTLTALRACHSGSFFLLLSHSSGVCVRLARIAFVFDTCNVSLKAAHDIGDAQMMVDVQCGQSIDVSRVERQSTQFVFSSKLFFEVGSVTLCYLVATHHCH